MVMEWTAALSPANSALWLAIAGDPPSPHLSAEGSASGELVGWLGSPVC